MHDNLVKRVTLAAYINCYDIVVMSCSHCAQHSIKCQVSYDSKKCDECVYHDMCYNISDSEMFNWSWLNYKQKKIHSALAEAKSVKNKTHSHIHHLKKQKKLLDHHENEIIYHDLKLLKELKHVKIEETTASTVNQDSSNSSTDIFNFFESGLTSVKWLSFWLKLVSFDNTV